MPNFEGRTSLNKLRRIKRLAEQPIDDLLPEFDNQECRIEQPWPYLASVQEVQENEELRTLINQSIGDLTDAYRIVLQLRDIEAYNTREVAELLGISEQIRQGTPASCTRCIEKTARTYSQRGC